MATFPAQYSDAFIQNVFGQITGSFAQRQFPNVPCSAVRLKAKGTNTGSFFIGGMSGTAPILQYQIRPGDDTGWFAISNLNQLFYGGCSGTADLALVFVGMHHAAAYDRVPERLATACAPTVLVGCSAGGVIGGGREVEQRPGLSVTAAVLPGVEVAAFHLGSAQLPALADDGAAWERLLAVPAAAQPQFILLPEPFSFDAERLLAGLDRWYPTSQKIGGVASGAREAGRNALFLHNEVHRTGLVGVALSGNVEVDTVVAQGCRPIGVPGSWPRSGGHRL